MGRLSTGFGLNIVFIDHLCTRLGTPNNFSAISNFHNSQITIASAKSFPACCVVTSRFLVTASNTVNSSASALQNKEEPSTVLTKNKHETVDL
jgi:hypothetical protein